MPFQSLAARLAIVFSLVLALAISVFSVWYLARAVQAMQLFNENGIYINPVVAFLSLGLSVFLCFFIYLLLHDAAKSTWRNVVVSTFSLGAVSGFIVFIVYFIHSIIL